VVSSGSSPLPSFLGTKFTHLIDKNGQSIASFIFYYSTGVVLPLLPPTASPAARDHYDDGQRQRHENTGGGAW
jgi:hypothetical protein